MCIVCVSLFFEVKFHFKKVSLQVSFLKWNFTSKKSLCKSLFWSEISLQKSLFASLFFEVKFHFKKVSLQVSFLKWNFTSKKRLALRSFQYSMCFVCVMDVYRMCIGHVLDVHWTCGDGRAAKLASDEASFRKQLVWLCLNLSVGTEY